MRTWTLVIDFNLSYQLRLLTTFVEWPPIYSSLQISLVCICYFNKIVICLFQRMSLLDL